MKKHGTRVRRDEPPSSMDMLRKVERAEQRLWLLAICLILLLTFSLFLLDATSVTVERLISGMSHRLGNLLSNYGASAGLLAIVLLVCAYFYENLLLVRTQNRQLVRALDSSARVLAQRNQQLDTWAQLSHSLITNFNLPRLLDLIVRTAAEVTASDCAAVMLREEGSPHLRLAAIHQRGLEMELARRAAAMVIETGQHIYLRPDALPQELDRPDLPWEDLVSLAAAPLVAGDTIEGALVVGRLHPHEAFAGQIADGLDSFASQASIALEKARLYRENQKQLDRLGKLLNDLRTTQDQLLQSERSAGLDTLAGGVAHIIRRPLAAIAARTDRLSEQGAWDQDAAREDVRAIREQTTRITDTLSALLRVSRQRGNQSMQWLDINGVVREALDLMRGEFQASEIEVQESYGELLQIRGNLPQLAQVFVNMLLSASHALRDGGRLAVHTSVLGPEWVRIEIAGSSRRAASASEGDLADPDTFQMDAAEAELDLTATERIVHAHGGELHVESESAGETRFAIQFPTPPPRDQSGADSREDTVAAGAPRAGV